MKVGSLGFNSIVLSVSLLAGCGGSSGGDGNTATSTPVNTNTANTSTPSSYTAPVNTTDYSAVTGFYDASKTTDNIKDENYLYIDAQGKVTAYHYTGNAKDSSNNCYREAISGDVNFSISGKTLYYSTTTAQFSVPSGTNTVFWSVDTAKKVTSISLNNTISGRKLSISSAGSSLIVDSVKITTPSVSDITTLLCK